MQPGTLGSVYTTVEGILTKILEQLEETNPFGHGDSAQGTEFRDFLQRIRVLKDGSIPFTIIMDDPLANCFIYNPNAPEDDPQIEVEIYDRTPEQDEDLAIADMMVD